MTLEGWPLGAGVSLGISARDVDALTRWGQLPPGTEVNVGFVDGESMRDRIRASLELAAGGLRPVPHIAARRLPTSQDLLLFLESLEVYGASDHVFVIGGDPSSPAGPFEEARDVLGSGLLKEHGVRSVSIGGYPEGHPEIGDDKLWRALERKARILSDMGLEAGILTQFTLDADAALRWTEEVRQRGIDLPIKIGIAGPASRPQLLGAAHQFGASTSPATLEAYGLDRCGDATLATPDRFVRRVVSGFDEAKHGAVGLHVFTFNDVLATARWVVSLAH